MSDESIKPPATWGDSVGPTLGYFDNIKFRIKLNESSLKADWVSFTPNKRIQLYIAFEKRSWPFYTNNAFTLRNSLFGTIKLITNPDPDKHSYSGYIISLNLCGTFSFPNGRLVKNVILFGTGRNSSVRLIIKKEI